MAQPPQEPPLPRYRFQESTGVWKKESPRLVGSAQKNSATGTGAGPARDMFESSYDYFLRRSYVVQSTTAKEERQQQARTETLEQLDKFQLRHLNAKDAEAADNDDDSSDDDEVATHHLTGTGKRAVAAAGEERLQLSETVHPIMGFISQATLPEVYAALRTVKGDFTSLADSSRMTRLSREEFHCFLTLVGDVTLISDQYESSMYTTLPRYDPVTQSADVFAVFSYMVDHRYHPYLNRNIDALFRAFDTDQKGLIPVEALHPRVVAAWAEENAFGNLREQWLKFAASLEEEETIGQHMFKDFSLVDVPTVAVLLCSSEQLFTCANTVDLDGG